MFGVDKIIRAWPLFPFGKRYKIEAMVGEQKPRGRCPKNKMNLKRI